MNINLNDYKQFVFKVTSNTSKDLPTLITRLIELDKKCNIASLLTASAGLAGESGEFAEIVKKVVYQGKEFNSEITTHLTKELGDVIFYWMLSCNALNLDPQKIIDINHEKLLDRYPDGFTVANSEKRKSGDI